MKILQCGYGAIGKELYPIFKKLAQGSHGEVYVYDPYKDDVPNKVENIDSYYDIAFVCVPTEKNEDGSCDTSIVEDICSKIKAGAIVIKSTVPVGFTRKLNDHYCNVIFSPEFTSTNQNKGIQNFVVLGGDRGLCKRVAELYKRIYPADFEIVYSNFEEAEMSKYMLNCYLALKVTFCNEIASACNESGIEYDDVRNIFIKDSRINPSHTWVYEDQPYYDSHCFNKDVPAFNFEFNLPLMKTVENINYNKKHRFEFVD